MLESHASPALRTTCMRRKKHMSLAKSRSCICLMQGAAHRFFTLLRNPIVTQSREACLLFFVLSAAVLAHIHANPLQMSANDLSFSAASHSRLRQSGHDKIAARMYHSVGKLETSSRSIASHKVPAKPSLFRELIVVAQTRSALRRHFRYMQVVDHVCCSSPPESQILCSQQHSQRLHVSGGPLKQVRYSLAKLVHCLRNCTCWLDLLDPTLALVCMHMKGAMLHSMHSTSNCLHAKV